MEFGIDLEALSNSINLSVEEIIELHSKPFYIIYFIGFLPGFLYLGGLDSKLQTPRKANPRLKVPKGSVAIGGNQTGIYPSESPGGWNIIGKSPINFFNLKNDTPCFAKPGDKLQFYPISKDKYSDIEVMVEGNVYQLESQKIND